MDLGIGRNDQRVNHVELPMWAKGSPVTFVSKMREALESDYVSSHLHHWIDLIFGYLNSGERAKFSNNLFFPTCYEENIDFHGITNEMELGVLKTQIKEFG